MTTPYHCKYFAHELTRLRAASDADKLSLSLFNASVDLNPHQIEAALFAFRSPLVKGVVLADETGLGKTIEAGLVACQLWAERKRRLLVICPAALRKQWSYELIDKFNLACVILETKSFNEAVRNGSQNPFEQDAIIVTSYNFAASKPGELGLLPWDLVILDEAHKLRNAYRPSNRTGSAIRAALESRKKLLLTATPLQNSLLELYGISTVIDEHIFGDRTAFLAQFGGTKATLPRCGNGLGASVTARCGDKCSNTSTSPSGGRSRSDFDLATTSRPFITRSRISSVATNPTHCHQHSAT